MSTLDDPIRSILGNTKQTPEEALVFWTRLFATHDRLMFKAFEREAGEERAFRMHKRVWENATYPLLPILQASGPGVEDAVAAFVRAFMVHDYYCFWIMVEEFGEVRAIETHHSIWESQDEEAGEVGVKELGKTGVTWEELYELYQEATDHEGIPFKLVEIADDHLTVEAKQCAYFDSMCHLFGQEKGEQLLHKIAIESTDRTIECFLAGVGQQHNVQGVMVKHRCHGDDGCRVVFTRRTPEGAPSRSYEV
ncbi:MAG: hypothetical protein ACRDOS_02325 [Gaiellaceae bacterium]